MEKINFIIFENFTFSYITKETIGFLHGNGAVIRVIN